MMKSVIFDLDGTILDTEQLHRRTFNMVLEELGIKLSEEKWESFRGLGTVQIFKEVFEERNMDVKLNDIIARRDRYFDELVEKEGIPLVKGFRNLYDMLVEKGVKVIIGTSGRRNNVVEELKLARLDIDFVCADDVKHTKPSPELFILAASKLNVDAKDCVVFEDSMAGIEAAHKAGMYAVGVSATTDKNELKEADLVIDDFSYFNEDKLNKLLF